MNTTSPSRQFQATILAAAQLASGREPSGTVVAATDDRAGSTMAVGYHFDTETVVWCAPEFADRLASIDGAAAISADEFVARAGEFGGIHFASGRHRILNGQPKTASPAPARVRWLDRTRPNDLELIETFVAGLPDDDLDEAELDLDDLDDDVVVILDQSGAIASYASGRPFDLAPAFDFIAVATRPDQRGQSLGAIVVGEFCRRRLALGRHMFYSCDVENIGSNRVAERVGFELACDVVAIDLSASER